MRMAAIWLATATLLASCGRSERGGQDSDPGLGTRGLVVSRIAQERGIEPRILLAAAYTQSRLGAGVESVKALPGTARATPFGLVGEGTTGKPSDLLAESAGRLADAIQAAALEGNATTALSWLSLTAEAIVGPSMRVQRRIVLEDLVRTYNEGFVLILPDGELITLAKAATPIQISGETQSTLGSGIDWPEKGESFPGTAEAEVSTRGHAQAPRILFRHCGASALACLELLQRTVTTPSHFMAFRDAQGRLRLVQMHGLDKDLTWYDAVAEDIISVTLTGFAEDRNVGTDPSWFSWHDYVQLRGMVQDLLTVGRAQRGQGPSLGGAALSSFVLLESATATVLETPAGQPRFALPAFWDSELMVNVLDGTVPGDCASDAVKVANPLATVLLPDGNLLLQLSAGAGARFMAADLLTAANTWELIRRTEANGTELINFQEKFSSPEGNNARLVSLRFRALDAQRRTCGFQIVRRVIP